MKRALLSFLILGLPSSVLSQETAILDPVRTPAPTGQRGTIALDAMTTPGRHFGIGFYVTDHLSLRPSLGIGFAENSGVFVTAGADLRYELTPGQDWSLYGTASLLYQGGQNQSYAPATTRPGRSYTSSANYDGFYYGAGLGVRRRVGDRLAFMLDGRYLHTANASVASSSFGQLRIDGQNQVVASLGLTFYLK